MATEKWHEKVLALIKRKAWQYKWYAACVFGGIILGAWWF